jgi:hypothetical protein
MPVFGTQMFGSGSESTFSIDKSCIWNGVDASMTRTPGSAGDRKTYTESIWVKRAKLDTDQAIGIHTTNGRGIWFNGDNTMSVYVDYDSSWTGKLTTTKTFRDPTAWYHFVLAVDTTQGTASNRIKFYVNGTQITNLSVAAYPAEDSEGDMCNTQAHYIGRYGNSATYWLNAYQAEMHFIDGTALTPSSFGETNDQGVWVPKKYTGGSYGTTGFYLDFADGADLGDDESGQGNDWAESNIAASDQSTDTPTNNHCTLNVLDPITGSVEVTEGARQVKFTGGDQDSVLGTIFQSKGKWYWEMKYVTAGGGGNWGITRKDFNVSSDFGSTSGSYAFRSGGDKINNNSAASYGSAWSADDIIQCAWDADNGKVFFGINNTWQASGDPAAGDNPAYSSIGTTVVDGGGLGPGASSEGNTVYLFRFTEAECSYDPPTGFKHLNTANIAEPEIKDGSTNFQMDDFAGTGSSNARTFGGNSDMQPDILWIKAKNTTTGWIEFNAAVGVQKYNMLNNQDGEASDSNSLTAFGSDGFTVGSFAAVNSGSYGFFAFGWSAGNSGSSNEAGSINTTTTFVDTSAGISVGTYTGTGSGATVGHGLGVTPATVIIFPRSNGDHKLVANWQSGISAYGEKWKLNDTEAASSSSNQITAASSTTFTLGTDAGVNGSSRTYSYYAFAEVEGFSRFGTYTGNANADGPFLYCGFTPQIFIAKADRAGEDWIQFNTKTDAYNPAINYAYPNDEAAFTNSSTYLVDFLSNGIKIRGTEGRINRDGETIVFMAFAENPFGGEEVAPATAR